MKYKRRVKKRQDGNCLGGEFEGEVTLVRNRVKTLMCWVSLLRVKTIGKVQFVPKKKSYHNLQFVFITM